MSRTVGVCRRLDFDVQVFLHHRGERRDEPELCVSVRVREFLCFTYLSTRPGNRALYASNPFLLTFLTSALASLAVTLITSSTSLARASFSRSGGLKQFKQANTLSAAVMRRLTDLSLEASERYGKMAGS